MSKRSRLPTGKRGLLKLDWKAYFAEFCRAHGDPVEVGGNLVFPDGWRYALDYRGPEYSPPGNPRDLQIAYCLKRRELVDAELKVLRDQLSGLENQQKRRDCPLQVRRLEDIDGKLERVTEELRLTTFTDDIEILETDLGRLDRAIFFYEDGDWKGFDQAMLAIQFGGRVEEGVR